MHSPHRRTGTRFVPREARHEARAVDAALRRAVTYRHPAGRIRRVETHISVIYLAGRFAYKRMKPVNFGFVDFGSLADRLRCCQAELKLNRPLAGPLYRAVVPVVRAGRRCALPAAGHDRGRTVDYLVQMRRFDESQLFSKLVARNALAAVDIDRAVDRLAAWHLRAPRRSPHPGYGGAERLRAQVQAVLPPRTDEPGSAALHAWIERQFARLAPLLEARRAAGFVRACHGDLHLDNVVRRGHDALMFDCIEFNDALRWNDVANDLAFFLMDLEAHGRADLARRALDRWLQATGDFAALAPMPLYLAYRALVRAMVARLKAQTVRAARGVRGQSPGASAPPDYAQVAMRMTAPRRPFLLLCHGYSGSGKSVASRALARLSGAIRVASDTERKRARPLSPVVERTLPASAYTPAAIDAEYAHLLDIAEQILAAGYPALVDATFLKQAHRARFVALARKLGVPVVLLDFDASRTCLEARVTTRSATGRDASDAGLAVLAAQLAQAEPFTADEAALVVRFNTEVAPARFETAEWWAPLFARLRAVAGVAPRAVGAGGVPSDSSMLDGVCE
ncbi:bifunctional aminoglycoside phosphotransferase/ATP-binding protein [Paraburkholderia kururiensis]|uniref:bifunctional aminoglycoside phosphotransferase/ATP-binding protein n=1 Tax=Paraburkholderia kururiensis TaxID=984307 RepID=UPI0018F75B71|nr:bifunctional aminoglycoside phosphotransferase/ATP-binding protein [Paraburkholderia kururiensis]